MNSRVVANAVLFVFLVSSSVCVGQTMKDFGEQISKMQKINSAMVTISNTYDVNDCNQVIEYFIVAPQTTIFLNKTKSTYIELGLLARITGGIEMPSTGRSLEARTWFAGVLQREIEEDESQIEGLVKLMGTMDQYSLALLTENFIEEIRATLALKKGLARNLMDVQNQYDWRGSWGENDIN